MKFLRHQRRPSLKSQTNQVLAQILSLYGDQRHSGRLVKFVPYQHSPDTLSFDENIFNSPEQINDKGGSDHGELNRSNVVENVSLSIGSQSVIDRNNVKNSVIGSENVIDRNNVKNSVIGSENVIDRNNVKNSVRNTELKVPDLTKPESLKAIDDKGISNHGKLCISVVTEPERFSSSRAMDIDESCIEKRARNEGELHLSEVTESEKLSPSVVDDGVCIHSKFSSIGGEVAKESRVSENDQLDNLDVLEHKDLSLALAIDVDESSGVSNQDVHKSDVVLEDSTSMVVSNHGEFGSSDHSVSEIVTSEVADESNKNRSREAEIASDEKSGIFNAEDDGVLLKKRENLAHKVNEGTFPNNDSGKERMMINEVEVFLDDVTAVSLMREVIIDKSNWNNGVCNQSASGHGSELKTLADESIERDGLHENRSTDVRMGLDAISNILNDDCGQEKMLIDELAALVNDVAADDHNNIMNACTALKDAKVACQSIIDTPSKEISVQPLDFGNRTESGEIEEGEVSDIIKAEVLSTLHLENSEKLDTEINAITELEVNIRDLESTDLSAMAVDSNDTNEGPECQPNVVDRFQQPRSNGLVFYGDVVEENRTTKEGLDLKKQDDGSGKKKKRGPISEKKKVKKKQKERKRRAEKNRELGVKRLKLQTVVMPKKVVICRHYLNGRCYEGEKCKFSHDAVPLTKSKPCGHFARQCCMKGDDCPFDHDLSKYPCTNYTSKGFCGRGVNCLFSHKLVSNEDQGIGTDDSKPGPKKQTEMNDPSKKVADNVLKHLGISFKGLGQCTTQSDMGKSQVSSSTSVGRHSPVKSELANQTAEFSLPAAQKSVDNVKTQPLLAPKGLNFLSFSRNSETLSPSAQNLTGNVKIQSLSAPKGINFLSFGRKNNPCSSSKPTTLFLSSVDKTEKLKKPTEVLMETKSPVTNLCPPTPSIERDLCTDKLETSSLKSLAVGFSSLPYKNITNSSQKALFSTLAFAARLEKETTMLKKNISAGADEGTSSSVSNSKIKTGCGSEDDDSDKALKILDFLASMGRKS